MKYLIYSLVLMLAIAACKPKDFPPLSNTPVFRTDFEVGTVSDSLIAGEDSIFMFTNYSKSSINNLYTLEGRFAKEGCFNCEPYLEVLINANKNVNGVIDFSLDSIKPGVTLNSFINAGASTTLAPDTFLFNALSPTPNSAWTFGDGSAGQGQLIEHIYSPAQNSYVFTYQFTNSINDQLVNKLNTNPFFFEGLFIDSIIGNSAVVVAANNCTSCASIINWGDGTSTSITSGGNPIIHSYAGHNKYKITKTSIQGNDTSIAEAIVHLDTVQVPYTVSPNITVSRLAGNPIVTDYINYNSVIINYAENGQRYSSSINSTIGQTPKPLLSIDNLTAYEDNELKQKTILIEGKADTYLYNVNNPSDSIRFKTKLLRFGVAVPK